MVTEFLVWTAHYVVYPIQKILKIILIVGKEGGGDRPGKQPIMGRISEVVDLTNRIIVSGSLVPWRQSEQRLATEQLNETVNKMRTFGQGQLLFVYDRGYPAKELIMKFIMPDGVV